MRKTVFQRYSWPAMGFARANLKMLLAFCSSFAVTTMSLRAETPMQSATTAEIAVRVPTSRLQNQRLQPLLIDIRKGIGPDEAATIALYSNPALRSIRDRRGLAIAQLIQAGILPNPVVSYARDFVTGGNTVGTTTAYTFSAGWEFSALIPFLPKQPAASRNLRSID